MKIVAAVALTLALGSGALKAETVDLATVKCSEIVSMNQEEGTFLFTWILGYAGGKAGSTVIDLSAVEAAGTEIGKYCGENPDVGVLSAAEAVLSD